MSRDAMQPSIHPGDDTLLAFAANQLEAMAAANVELHLAGCTRCEASVSLYRLVRNTLRQQDFEPPASAVARAKALFVSPAPTPQVGARLLAPLRRILAELAFDSGNTMAPSMAGFRGGGDRQLTYVARELKIDLRLTSSEEGSWRMLGQVEAEILERAGTAALVTGVEERRVTQSSVDEWGMFSLTAPPGTYDLHVRFSDTIHVLPGIELGQGGR